MGASQKDLQHLLVSYDRIVKNIFIVPSNK